MNEVTSQTTTQPEWLKKLEEESWQAELIISGLAIYGSPLLPDLIEWLMDRCLSSLDYSISLSTDHFSNIAPYFRITSNVEVSRS